MDAPSGARRRPGKRWSKDLEPAAPHDPILKKLQAEARPEIDGGMAAVEDGLHTLIELMVEQGGEIDEKEAADVCVNVVVTDLQKRLRALHDKWAQQRTELHIAKDKKIKKIMAEVQATRQGDREELVKQRNDTAREITTEVRQMLAEEKEALDDQLATTHETLDADALDNEADGELAALVATGQAKLAKTREDMTAKLDARRAEQAAELAEVRKRTEGLMSEYSDDVVRRRLKLQSQVAIEKARVSSLERAAEEDAEKQQQLEQALRREIGERTAEATERLRQQTVEVTRWQEERQKELNELRQVERCACWFSAVTTICPWLSLLVFFLFPALPLRAVNPARCGRALND